MTCIEDYNLLIDALDAEIARIGEMHAAALSCGPGCASCCQPFSVLAIEAACIRKAIAALPAARLKHLARTLGESPDRCPLLIDDLCGIYAARPVICRTQGLPLAYVDEERQAIEVSACALNFPDDYAFVAEQLLFMDRFNSRLSALNRAWCQAQGIAPDHRIPLTEIVRPAAPGE